MSQVQTPFVEAGSVVYFTHQGSRFWGKVTGGDPLSLRITEIVPLLDGDRAPKTFEFTTGEWKTHGVVDQQLTDAQGKIDLRKAVEQANRGVSHDEIINGFSSDRDPSDENIVKDADLLKATDPSQGEQADTESPVTTDQPAADTPATESPAEGSQELEQPVGDQPAAKKATKRR